MKKRKSNMGARRKKKVNRKYKDRLFRMVFQEKKDLLDLYNAVNHTNYTDPESLQITTMKDAVLLGMKNDVSFLIDSVLNLYEHQSTFNPNMPVRGFFYFADIMRTYIQEHELNIYGKKRIKLPVPRYIVFYNGAEGQPDRRMLRLSECFGDDPEAALECTAVMLNINYGHNRELMERCQRLEEYAYFVAAVRRNAKENDSLEEAVLLAIDECIEKNKLADILRKNRWEVVNMLLTEFNMEEYGKLERRDGYEDGRKEGREYGIQLTKQVLKLAAQGMSAEKIAEELQVQKELVDEILA